MGCRICGRSSCTESFHSHEEQQNFEDSFGKYEIELDELKEANRLLKAENKILYNLLPESLVTEYEKELLMIK